MAFKWMLLVDEQTASRVSRLISRSVDKVRPGAIWDLLKYSQGKDAISFAVGVPDPALMSTLLLIRNCSRPGSTKAGSVVVKVGAVRLGVSGSKPVRGPHSSLSAFFRTRSSKHPHRNCSCMLKPGMDMQEIDDARIYSECLAFPGNLQQIKNGERRRDMKIRKTITIEGEAYELHDEFLSHVLETAVEGGCSYWADIDAEHTGSDAGADGARDFDVSDYTEEDADENEGDAPFYTSASFIASNDATQGGTLDLEGMADAIERIANGEVDVAPAIREIIIAAVRDNDAAEIDTEAADCIVQIGLFDEVVYS